PLGRDPGSFTRSARADARGLVGGAIIGSAREGPSVAPCVTRLIGHYLGVDTTAASNVRIVLPADTAPHSRQLLPGPPSVEDSTIVPIAPTDTGVTPPDTGNATPAPRDR